MDTTNSRKVEHIRIIREDRGTDRRKFYFDDVRLKHRALPELNLADVDPSTEFLGKRLSFPLLISSMTGGDHSLVRKINRNLAIAAEAEQVALGVGSQRVMFTNPKARASFELREFAPTTLLFANLGAVQLNYGFGIAECREAVKTVGADALFLHLNPLQEAVQPEGDTNFAGLGAKIGAIAKSLDVPVILKEVGAGISREDAELAMKNGVKIIDVAGSGGTSWSRIEHHRASMETGHPAPSSKKAGQDAPPPYGLGLLFQDWGIPTPDALRELAPLRKQITLIASGGIRSGLDIAKAVVLGASLGGLAQPFLEPATKSPDAVRKVIQRLRREFVTTMFLLGVTGVGKLKGNAALLANG